jgi:hypothetical protein
MILFFIHTDRLDTRAQIIMSLFITHKTIVQRFLWRIRHLDTIMWQNHYHHVICVEAVVTGRSYLRFACYHSLAASTGWISTSRVTVYGGNGVLPSFRETVTQGIDISVFTEKSVFDSFSCILHINYFQNRNY